jgi:hypothetical protein
VTWSEDIITPTSFRHKPKQKNKIIRFLLEYNNLIFITLLELNILIK